MNPLTIVALIQAAETAIGAATEAYTSIKGTLSAADQAAITAAVTSSGAALDAVRSQLDADAA
jgi:hypothetical protein